MTEVHRVYIKISFSVAGFIFPMNNFTEVTFFIKAYQINNITAHAKNKARKLGSD